MDSYVVSGIMLTYLQSYLKRFDWYGRFVVAFPAADKYVHRMIAGLGSFLMALGITYSMTGDAATGWQLTFAIPNQADLYGKVAEATMGFVKVFISQQVTYDATRRPAAMPHDEPAAEAIKGKK